MTFNFSPVPEAVPARNDAARTLAEAVGDEGEKPRLRALLVGHPNVGKSVVFGALTGTYVAVSNYPGTTVEITRGTARFGERAWQIVDTPGTHNLVPMSDDEAVTRDILVSEHYDALVQVGDAKNLARTLLLTMQLAELGVPFCLDLNMADEARARGFSIDLPALEAELGHVRVRSSTATEGEGLEDLRDYLASCSVAPAIDAASGDPPAVREPLSCAPRFPGDVEAAIADVEARLPQGLPVAKRAVATMLLGGDRGVMGDLAARAGADAISVAKERSQSLARAHGVPVFALMSRLRLTRARAIATAVQARGERSGARAHAGQVTWTEAVAVAGTASLVAALAYDGAVARTQTAAAVDPLGAYGALDVIGRFFSAGLFRGWTAPGLSMLAASLALGVVALRRHARARAGGWKLAGAFALGWTAYWLASIVESLAAHVHSSLPVHIGAVAGLVVVGAAARAGDRRDATLSQAVGRTATDPVWGLPILALVLLLAYKVVGVFGAGTAVDFLEHRVFGSMNARLIGVFDWIGVPLLTAFFVGPYGLVTMGVTYAVAIVLPVVTTFFFVFSVLEDSGYLPRLAVMSNRLLRGMGLNGKAVLPMVLGLGCDTMATLTARIMETRKEKMLITLLLALGIPCSSQLSVIFALMQRTSHAATFVWIAVVLGTLLGVGWIAAKVLPGDRSDFLLEMPPIRQPMISNIVSKTMARIEWYLKEAVPLFLLGTALLFVLDTAHLLGVVHRLGEPIVHHALGFPRDGAVSDRVSEALLIGFLRRDFGAAGLLDLARAGRLSPADVAVSMVTITLFIPCIANVFMIAKERGWKVAGAMSGFIFPYAIAVGALVRVGFRFLGGAP
jgi:Fe2+ transport system protein B